MVRSSFHGRSIKPDDCATPFWGNRLLGGGSMTNWKCGNCGYEMEADAPPETCPSCKEKCEFLDNSCYTPDCDAVGKDPRIG
jgi:rubredoxin